MHYFSIFFKKFNKDALILRVWTKFTNCWEIFRKFLQKIVKMHYFSIFFKRFNKACVNFARLDENHKLLGNFEKIFENFQKISKENCEKCIILAYFSKKFSKPCFFFAHMDEKHNCCEPLRKF